MPSPSAPSAPAAIFDYMDRPQRESADLYRHDELAQPVQGVDALDDAHTRFYAEHGYLAVESFFTADEVATTRAALGDLLHGRVAAFNSLMFESGVKDSLATMSEAARADAVRKVSKFVQFEPRLDALSKHPRLVAAVERLMGRRAQLFQDMAMLKPPRMGREKPWHQDHAYFDLPSEDRVVGVWIALDRATPANGCMHVLDGGHRDGAIIHFKRRDWQICDTQVMDYKAKHPCVAVPLAPGGVLFFDSFLPHGTPTNDSDQRRWAVQFHYAPADAVKCSEADRLERFGSEGKDVEC